MEVKVINKGKNPLPQYACIGDAGLDLRADFSDPDFQPVGAGLDVVGDKDSTIESVTVHPGGRVLIPTRIHMAIPEGYELQVRSRSGLAIKKGIFVLNSPGTVDAGYRDSVGVILANFSAEPFTIKQGDRIAQAVLNKFEHIDWKPVDDLDETDRDGGFGHTDDWQ